jgi:mRNA interferase MazF
MTRYKVVLVPFPFDGLSTNKVRPAVCLTDPIGPHRHLVLAFITSRVLANPLPTDVVLSVDHPDFAKTGLRVSSTIQLHRLITVTDTIIRRELGALTSNMRTDVDDQLRKLFQLT